MKPGRRKLGPDNASLQVKTGRRGAAAKAGHDLVIEVTDWEATLDVGEDPGQVALELKADAASLRVREGTGGVQELGDDDKADIKKTIDDELLKREPIEFRSTEVDASDEGGQLRVRGDLKLAGNTHPVEFDLSVGSDGQIKGGAALKQTDWKIKPYSGLFGALKVADEVEIVGEAGPL
jgi:polyisoprenoid-binding protein YceI